MKKSELKAKFGRYSAEEKWQHYFACKKKIKKLKQQLDEKDKEINSLIVDYEKRISQEQELMSNMEHRLVEKDNLIEYGKEEIRKRNKRIDEIVERYKKLFAEKDKEIEELKTKQELTFIHSKEDYFQRCNLLEEENIKLQFAQTQLAIQELEKVKTLIQNAINFEKPNFVEVYDAINKQINELKGGKDVED